MLRAYGPGCDGSLIDTHGSIPATATWIDLEEPTREEERMVEQALGFPVPTHDDMVEIEPSSRLYERDGALVLTISVLFGLREGIPQSAPISFVVKNGKLVTVHYVTPKPWMAFTRDALARPEMVRDSPTALTNLLDAIVDRLADELETAGAEIERIGLDTFHHGEGDTARVKARCLETLLNRIGRTQSLISKIRETAVSSARAVSFLLASERMHEPDCIRARELVDSLGRDLNALIDHSGYQAGQLTFLLDASLGLISMEQNGAMKLFSWSALIFLPPTLIAGIYGMNFDYMPELHARMGYPLSLSLMLLSAVLPLWFLRRRGLI